MKKNFSKLLTGMLGIMVLLAFTQCKSSAPSVKMANEGAVEVIQYCSGPEHQSTPGYFRANATGESMDMQVSKQKALSNARTNLAAEIGVNIKNATEAFTKSSEMNQVEDLEKLFQSLTVESTNQYLTGVRTICEKVMQTKDGRYTTYVAIEKSSEEVANAIRERLTADQKLRIDFDYERFKKTFNEEMEKHPN